MAESFFATLKVELVHDATWATRATARTELFEYLEVFYNGAATSFGAWLPQPSSVRAAARTRSTGNLTQVSTKPGQDHCLGFKPSLGSSL